MKHLIPAAFLVAALLHPAPAQAQDSGKSTDWSVVHAQIGNLVAAANEVFLVRVVTVQEIKNARSENYSVTAELLASLKNKQEIDADKPRKINIQMYNLSYRVGANPLAYPGALSIGQTLIVFLKGSGDKQNFSLAQAGDSLTDARHLQDLLPAFKIDIFSWIAVMRQIDPDTLRRMCQVLLTDLETQAPAREEMEELSADIDSPDYSAREKASSALTDMGCVAIPRLMEISRRGSPEAADRANEILTSYRKFFEFFEKIARWNPVPLWIELLDHPEFGEKALEKLRSITGKKWDADKKAWREYHLANPDAHPYPDASPLRVMARSWDLSKNK